MMTITTLLTSMVISNSLKVGYVEFRAGEDAATPQQTIIKNMNSCLDLISDGATQGADIMVIPEYGITGFPNDWDGYTVTISNSLLNEIPCDIQGSPEIIKLASCAARNLSIYILINIAEQDGSDQYNTNIVLTPTGKLLLRYRKMNLWGEPSFSTPKTCDATYFGITPTGSDSQIKIGIMTCADLVFGYPQSALFKEQVDVFILPVAWSNVMPQMQVLAYAQGWSLINNKTIVISNHNYGTDMTGSGVFQNGNVLSWYYNPGIGNVIKVTEINLTNSNTPNKKQSIDRIPSIPTIQHPLALPLQDSEWQQLLLKELKPNQLSGSLCVNNICCDVNANLNKDSNENTSYYLVALDGFDTGGGCPKHWRSMVCGVAFCEGDDCNNYYRPFNSKNSSRGIVSLSIHIKGASLYDANQIIPEVSITSPVTEDNQQPPLYNFSSSSSEATLSLRNSNNYLISAFIYGRGFQQDPLPYNCPP